MKRTISIACALVLVLGLCVSGALAYTINDSSSDAIGAEFESYGINVLNYTPGVNSGAISFQLFTDYPQAGITVGAWATTAADLFIKETYHGADYLWAIPLVSRTGFDAGTLYAVGTYKISDDFDPSPGSFIYNHNVPVQIATVGDNYGWTSMGGGSVSWNALVGNPAWQVDVVTGGVYQDDPNGKWCITWGTATCANDVVHGCVPIPPSVLLMGSGLLGLGLLSLRKKTEV